MASVNGGGDLQLRVVSRRLVKASDSSIKPHVLSLSNLDLLNQSIQASTFCIYPKPSTGAGGGFDAVVAAFESGLSSFLNHFFPFAGRIATDPGSGLPELRCGNQGAELVVGEAGVALATLDYGAVGAAVRRFQLPYAEDVPLSVQVVSFACGGFTVAWCTHHVLLDGKSLSFLVNAWSELARSGETLAAGSRPNHDRSVFRPREPPSYSATLDEAFTPLDTKHQINVLTANQSFVERLYYIDASDIERLRRAASRNDGYQRATRVQAVSAYLWKALAGVVAGTAEARCRMGWRVDGRRRIADPERRAAMRNYVGNFITYAVGEASVAEVLRMPLPDVAAMVREAIAAPAPYEERLQELVDWVEEHKTRAYVETAILGVGSPILSVTTLSSFRTDTDFGFGHAAMAVPTATAAARLCSGYVQVFSRPGDEGTWFVNALVWPELAAALEADEPRVLRPVTAEYLGLSLASHQVQRCRL
ncbi:hypothetical protein SETIT_5G053800v2 [Setaria italica]|uniref:Uncharacterized protein n=1 Tax=Setaria italica TaxID=4555 RepID=A0A368R1H4_SETIT|nr:omega-hydroxypalmitate O-feruloyl transferase [Setaria italica]RCV24047.1 hypothetical protein SETIT_5G053800v2 [Setaria italica]